MGCYPIIFPFYYLNSVGICDFLGMIQRNSDQAFIDYFKHLGTTSSNLLCFVPFLITLFPIFDVAFEFH